MSPPPDTVHLLLVSKGFSALALPLYWRSVTILKSDEWVKLWGPGKGLFVGGRASASEQTDGDGCRREGLAGERIGARCQQQTERKCNTLVSVAD